MFIAFKKHHRRYGLVRKPNRLVNLTSELDNHIQQRFNNAGQEGSGPHQVGKLEGHPGKSLAKRRIHSPSILILKGKKTEVC